MNINLSNLPVITTSKKKRVGRGYGSGKGGHTASRGQKGQKSRSRLPLLFEGSKQRKSLIRRTPFLRGKLRNKPMSSKPIIVNLKHLEIFDNGAVIDIGALVKRGMVDRAEAHASGVKILGDGELTKKLTVHLKCSKSAQKKISQAGGKVVVGDSPKKPAKTEAKKKPVNNSPKPNKAKPAVKKKPVKKTIKAKTSK